MLTIMLFRTYKGSRYRAATVFILGFWMLDLANNTVQVTLFQIFACDQTCPHHIFINFGAEVLL